MSQFIYVVQMDIDPALEARFNELYDVEHLPAILTVPGVERCRRYRLHSGGSAQVPKYLAIYDLASPAVRQSPAWDSASDAGLWRTEIRPFTCNKSHLFFEQIIDRRRQ